MHSSKSKYNSLKYSPDDLFVYKYYYRISNYTEKKTDKLIRIDIFITENIDPKAINLNAKMVLTATFSVSVYPGIVRHSIAKRDTEQEEKER